MRISVRDYVDKGYLVVSQQLELLTSSIARSIILYVDSATVSCLRNDLILQYPTFEELVAPLGLIGVQQSILLKIKTADGSNMYQIRKQYIKDFDAKFHIKKKYCQDGKVIFEISSYCLNNVSLAVLRKQIMAYNNSMRNFEFTVTPE